MGEYSAYINLVGLTLLHGRLELLAILEGLITDVDLIRGSGLYGETPLSLAEEVPLVTGLVALFPVVSVAEPIIHHLEREETLVVNAEELGGKFDCVLGDGL